MRGRRVGHSLRAFAFARFFITLLMAVTVHGDMVCENECESAAHTDKNSDGICQDGGAGSEYGPWPTCALGHDCADCGPRNVEPPAPPAGPPPITPPGFVLLCENDCYSDPPQHYDKSSDGMCNDGGPGSETYGWVDCQPGHDCADCGPRLLSPATPPMSPPPYPPAPPPLSPGGVCKDDCVAREGDDYSADGECDDGGPDSDYASCAPGYDCTDCGSRITSPSPPPPVSPPPPSPSPALPPPLPPGGICEDTCSSGGGASARDGYCDDGGPGHTYSACAYGSDCTDCGIRITEPPSPPRPSPPPPWPPYTCTNTCGYNAKSHGKDMWFSLASNGICQDGGPGAESTACDVGSDCVDCGRRFANGLPNGGVSTASSSSGSSSTATGSSSTATGAAALNSMFAAAMSNLTVCHNDCIWHKIDQSSNGICQDGGPGSEYSSMCGLGHDCQDCGPRIYSSTTNVLEFHYDGLLGNFTSLLNNATATVTRTVDTDVNLLSSKMTADANAMAGAATGMMVGLICVGLCCACSCAAMFWFFNVRPTLQRAQQVVGPTVVELSDGRHKVGGDGLVVGGVTGV